jgi:glycosyltransferase involved in cell wall biosynthesis
MNQSEGRILVCGPRAKGAVTGVALAVDLLFQGLERGQLKHRVVDATFGGSVSKSGTFAIGRAFETACVVFAVWWNLLFCKIYYATMSTSSVGFIRDYLTIGFAKLLGRRTVLHLHGGGFEDFYTNSKPWLQRLIRSNLMRTDTIVVLGELLKEQFYCVGEFVKPRLTVVSNGLTLGVDEPSAKVKAVSDGGRIELLYLSSLMPSKGFFDVLQSMVFLEKQNLGRYHLNLCGSFVDAKTETAVEVHNEASLRDYIKKHELGECVTYHGQILGEAKDRQFAQANVFLLPTSYPWEGQPLSIIEAIAFSAPVISCCHKGIPELVEDGKAGVFVKPESPESIASAVVQITSDTEVYTGMSRAARQHYEMHFRRDVHLKRLISVIMGCEVSD